MTAAALRAPTMTNLPLEKRRTVGCPSRRMTAPGKMDGLNVTTNGFLRHLPAPFFRRMSDFSHTEPRSTKGRSGKYPLQVLLTTRTLDRSRRKPKRREPARKETGKRSKDGVPEQLTWPPTSKAVNVSFPLRKTVTLCDARTFHLLSCAEA
jgi:hypothetical protein